MNKYFFLALIQVSSRINKYLPQQVSAIANGAPPSSVTGGNESRGSGSCHLANFSLNLLVDRVRRQAAPEMAHLPLQYASRCNILNADSHPPPAACEQLSQVASGSLAALRAKLQSEEEAAAAVLSNLQVSGGAGSSYDGGEKWGVEVRWGREGSCGWLFVFVM